VLTSYHSLSIVCGGLACNAKCPFCVAHMTPRNGVTLSAIEPNWIEFRKACAVAKECGVEQVTITSKGEPTLWPDLISKYLVELAPYRFDKIDLQTNGIPISRRKPVTDRHLEFWAKHGLKLVSVSIVHYDAAINRSIYLRDQEDYIDLSALIGDLHDGGLAVRLACVMFNGGIDSPLHVANLIDFARENQVEQLTFRPVDSPSVSGDTTVSQWISENKLRPESLAAMSHWIHENGSLEHSFPWGAAIYDVRGQNVCLTNSLTKDIPSADRGRYLIFFPEGGISDSWEKSGVPVDTFAPMRLQAIRAAV
jgi:molybdenum cofactor biosynthesis enzyme MoaA